MRSEIKAEDEDEIPFVQYLLGPGRYTSVFCSLNQRLGCLWVFVAKTSFDWKINIYFTLRSGQEGHIRGQGECREGQAMLEEML